MSGYLLAGSALFACLGAGVAGVQGVQMVRYRGEGQNVLLALVAAVAALVGVALFALTLRSPAAFFTALRHGTTGIAIYLYATLALVIGCAVAIVMAKRSEDGSVARWVGVMLLVLAVLLVFGAALGFLKSAFVKVDGRFWALLAFFVGLALCLGAFAQFLVGAVRNDEEACSFGRAASLVGAVALMLGAAVFMGWFLLASGAGASDAARAAFSFSGYTANMGAAHITAADQLAELASGNAALFWGGAVACGLLIPLACGIGARVMGGDAGEKGLAVPFGVVGLTAALIGGYCLCLVVGMMV